MKIKFLRGYRGRDTGEVYYEKGTILDDEHGAGSLVHLAPLGVIEILPDDELEPVVEVQPEPVAEPEPVKVKPKKAGKK